MSNKPPKKKTAIARRNRLDVSTEAASLETTVEGQRVFRVDATKLPAPTRSLSASRVTAVLDDGDLTLVFAQAAPGSTKPAAALVVSMPANIVRTALVPGNDGFVETLRKYASGPLTLDTFEVPERTAYERATAMAMYANEHEGELRFFHISAGEVASLPPNTLPEIKPVVSVFLPIRRMAAMVLSIQAMLSA